MIHGSNVTHVVFSLEKHSSLTSDWISLSAGVARVSNHLLQRHAVRRNIPNREATGSGRGCPCGSGIRSTCLLVHQEPSTPTTYTAPRNGSVTTANSCLQDPIHC